MEKTEERVEMVDGKPVRLTADGWPIWSPGPMSGWTDEERSLHELYWNKRDFDEGLGLESSLQEIVEAGVDALLRKAKEHGLRCGNMSAMDRDCNSVGEATDRLVFACLVYLKKQGIEKPLGPVYFSLERRWSLKENMEDPDRTAHALALRAFNSFALVQRYTSPDTPAGEKERLRSTLVKRGLLRLRGGD